MEYVVVFFFYIHHGARCPITKIEVYSYTLNQNWELSTFIA